ncbi:MAG: hypothetical protein FJZ86_03085 [Chloroflexi bacterium]|nr:hypothetical protein [Chloroflexota bacterium]
MKNQSSYIGRLWINQDVIKEIEPHICQRMFVIRHLAYALLSYPALTVGPRAPAIADLPSAYSKCSAD